MGEKSTKNGKIGESMAAEFFRKKGYWCHVTKRSSNGSQPVDIIAIRESKVWLVDAKYVAKEKPSFPFSDIQPDQLTSMKYASGYAKIPKESLGFFIVFEREEESPRFMSYSDYLCYDSIGRKSVGKDELPTMEEAEGEE